MFFSLLLVWLCCQDPGECVFCSFHIGSCSVASTPRHCGICSPAQITAPCLLSSTLCTHSHARGPIRPHLVSRQLNIYPTQLSPGTECTGLIQKMSYPAPGFSSSCSGALTFSGSLDASFLTYTSKGSSRFPVTLDKLCPDNSGKFPIILWIAADLLQQGQRPNLGTEFLFDVCP